MAPSEAAIAYRKSFKEVLVDEYQDVNMVQETIVQLVPKRTKAQVIFLWWEMLNSRFIVFALLSQISF